MQVKPAAMRAGGTHACVRLGLIMKLADRWAGYPWNTNPWTKHRQSVWRERALDKAAKYPIWVRIGMLALGGHRKTGRADFAPGELKQLLGVASDSHLANELRKAKDAGWITHDSTAMCLTVPAHAVQGGL